MIQLPEQVTWWQAQSGGAGDVFAAPRILDGRWEDQFVDFKGPGGRSMTSQAVVYLEKEVSVGDWLAPGSQLKATPSEADRAYQVQAFMKIPDLRSLNQLNRALV